MATAAAAGAGADAGTQSRKRDGSTVFTADADYLEFTPLGAGSEVGRSCHIIRFKGKTIMLDCGIHPAFTGIASLPYIDEVDASEIDLLLVSHFHLDHAAALPYFLEKTSFKGKVYMTHPTKSIYKLILQDYVKVSSISSEENLYDEQDLLNSMDKIDTINYHQVVHHDGIKFWCYNAGHVLGAAMFMIEIAGVRILYTGDYSRREDRHLMAAETPKQKPDILIVEATYGAQTLQPIAQREKRFTDIVHRIVSGRGRCLIPVFALGRAQELLLILDEFWEANPRIQTIPIYYASALAKKCMTVYRTYVNMMNKRIQTASQVANPFIFRHILNLRGMDQFVDKGACVVMASPGMLQNGLSRQLFDMWCTDKRNGVVIPGYCVENTMAKDIFAEPSHVETLSGQVQPLNCSVHYISFSAHADYSETSAFVKLLKPPHVVLVHGVVNQMSDMKKELQRQYKDGSVQISTPRNCQTIEFEFRAQKVAKVVGQLATTVAPDEGAVISGLVVRRDFKYHIMETRDLSEFTTLASTTVRQRLTVPFKFTHDALVTFVGQMYEYTVTEPIDNDSEAAGDADSKKGHHSTASTDNDTSSAATTTTAGQPAAVPSPYPVIHISDAVSMTVIPEGAAAAVSSSTSSPSASSASSSSSSTSSSSVAQHILLEWNSNPVNDMIADSLVALVMTMQTSATVGSAKAMGITKCNHDHSSSQSKGSDNSDATATTKTEPASNSMDDDEDKDAGPVSLKSFLLGHFTPEQVRTDATVPREELHIVTARGTAVVHRRTLAVQCEDDVLASRLRRLLPMMRDALQPAVV